MILYKGRWCFSKSQTPLYILIKRKQIKKLPKNHPPHGSSNNQKETKSHGSPCDSTINHKETISHGSHVIPQLITRKQNHMVPHVISHLITRKQCHMTTQLTSFNNYLSNSSSYTPSYRGTVGDHPKKDLALMATSY
jgi:hypothetical protein